MTRRQWRFWTAIGLIAAVGVGLIVGQTITRCDLCQGWQAGIDRHERNEAHWLAELARDSYLAHRKHSHAYQTPRLQEMTS